MAPTKYRKKPVVVEAWRITETNRQSIVSWIFDNKGDVEVLSPYLAREAGYDDSYAFHVKTLEGFMLAVVGDYIIRGIEGEFYPCKAHIFTGSYTEEVEEVKGSAGIPGLGIPDFGNGTPTV